MAMLTSARFRKTGKCGITLRSLSAGSVWQSCATAKTGKWKAGWFKKTAAKSMAWKGEMPGHNSWGYKDVFKYKCWHGPKSYGDLLGFDDAFADHYDLTTPSGTFNKKVCGCRSADDCTGHYKPGELYHRSG